MSTDARQLVEQVAAEADASRDEPMPADERVNSRNGYRHRGFDTRVGTLDVAVPKLRSESYYPDWLLQPRRRAEKALISVVATAYLLGVSTRRVEKLVQTLGVEKMSKSQVSELAKSLDRQVNEFRNRPLDAGPYTYVWIDALTQRVREGGRIVNVSALVATGVNVDGHREILGVDVATGEDGPSRLAFCRALVTRGLSGVQLVTSDAHVGLKAAIAATLPGACSQRCRTHYTANLLTQIPKSAQGLVGSLIRSIFDQPDAASRRSWGAAALHRDDQGEGCAVSTCVPDCGECGGLTARLQASLRARDSAERGAGPGRAGDPRCLAPWSEIDVEPVKVLDRVTEVAQQVLLARLAHDEAVRADRAQ